MKIKTLKRILDTDYILQKSRETGCGLPIK
jgi:hypothetical protein